MTLIRGLKNNARNSFNEIFDTYHSTLYFFILDKTHSHDMAQEVVQLTFIRLWQKKDLIKEETNLKSFLFTIAKNIFIDEVRKTKANIIPLESSEIENKMITNNSVENLFYQDTKERIEKLILDLPPVRQRVFYLSRMKQLNHKEIAELMSISQKTVETHISLAIKHIRRYF